MPRAYDINDIWRQSGLPVLPLAYLEICEQGKNGNAEAVAAGINSHQMLRDGYLKLVNSAMYANASGLTDVSVAVRQIGAEASAILGLAVGMVNFFIDVGPDIVSKQAFWRHSIACGIACRHLALLRKEKNAERFFLIGLLHDIGSLMIYMNISERTLLDILHGRDVSNPLFQLERDLIGFDHAQLGGEVLRSLQLPDWLTEGVSRHHAPDMALGYPVEASVAHVADIIINAMRFGTRGEYKVPPLSPSAWDAVGLPIDVLGDVIQQVDRQLDAVVQALATL